MPCIYSVYIIIVNSLKDTNLGYSSSRSIFTKQQGNAIVLRCLSHYRFDPTRQSVVASPFDCLVGTDNGNMNPHLGGQGCGMCRYLSWNFYQILSSLRIARTKLNIYLKKFLTN